MGFIGFYNYTVVLTYISLISSLVGMLMAAQGKSAIAIGLLLLSGVCDMFDGIVARSKKNRTEDEKNFGIQLDSLCDVVCFGVFPAVFLYFSGVNSILGICILVFYALCGLIRLAFFNVLETKRQMNEDGCAKSYRGLPITTAAIIFPIFFGISLFCPDNIMTVIYHIVPVLAGFLFICDFRLPKIDYVKMVKKLFKKI